MKRIALLLVALLGFSVVRAEMPAAMYGSAVWGGGVGSAPITGSASLLMGNVRMANHFLGAQEFSGFTTGLEVELGRLFRDKEDLSWTLTLSRVNRTKGLFSEGLRNPASTNFISLHSYDVNYSVCRNWTLGEGLKVKVGGAADLYGDWGTMLRYQMNNAHSLNAMAQIEAVAGIHYTTRLGKWGVGVYGNISTPLLGVVFTDADFEGGFSSIIDTSVSAAYVDHLCGTSLHNLQGVKTDFGVQLVRERVTYSLGYQNISRWWFVNDVQNYRKGSFFKFGISVRLVTHKQSSATSRYF